MVNAAKKTVQLSFFNDSLPQQNLDGNPSVYSSPEIAPELPPIVASSNESPMSRAVIPVRSNGKLLRVDDVLPDYYNYLNGAKGFSSHTVDGFCSDIRKLAAFAADRPLAQLNTSVLAAFLSGQRSKGGTRKLGAKNREGSADTTVYRLHTSLRSFFRWLHEERVISDNPGKNLYYKRPEPPDPVILTKEEESKFLDASKASHQEHLVALLLLGSGLKRGELLGLNLSSINITNRVRPVINVTGSHAREVIPPLDFVLPYRQYLDATYPEIFTGKTDEWSGDPCDLLADYLEKPVFALTDRTLSYLIDRVTAKAGIHKKVSCETLKHSFAVFQLRAGNKMEEDIKKVFVKLGLADTGANNRIRRVYIRLAGQR